MGVKLLMEEGARLFFISEEKAAGLRGLRPALQVPVMNRLDWVAGACLPGRYDIKSGRKVKGKGGGHPQVYGTLNVGDSKGAIT